jgi:hypothetical protein
VVADVDADVGVIEVEVRGQTGALVCTELDSEGNKSFQLRPESNSSTDFLEDGNEDEEDGCLDEVEEDEADLLVTDSEDLGLDSFSFSFADFADLSAFCCFLLDDEDDADLT